MSEPVVEFEPGPIEEPVADVDILHSDSEVASAQDSEGVEAVYVVTGHRLNVRDSSGKVVHILREGEIVKSVRTAHRKLGEIEKSKWAVIGDDQFAMLEHLNEVTDG